MNPLYEQMATSVFERMSGLAAEHGAVNLGQGFPDFGWPTRFSTCRGGGAEEGSNQYAPSRGLPRCARRSRAITAGSSAQQLDADNVCVTSGATEALGAAILATVAPGDEVIIFTPAYDSYAPMIRRGGRDAARSGAAAAGMADRSLGDRGGDQPKDPRDPVQQSAQSRGPAVRRGRARNRSPRSPAIMT